MDGCEIPEDDDRIECECGSTVFTATYDDSFREVVLECAECGATKRFG